MASSIKISTNYDNRPDVIKVAGKSYKVKK